MDRRNSFEKEKREKKGDKNVSRYACVFSSNHVCMWRIQMCVCVMEKKEKTAYLENMIEKSFDIVKSNISEVQNLLKQSLESSFTLS